MPLIEVTPGVFELVLTLDLDPTGLTLVCEVEDVQGRIKLTVLGPASPAGATIQILRVHPSGRFTFVRSANGIPFAQGGVYYDHEAPIRRACTYTAFVHNSDGTLWAESNEDSCYWDTDQDWIKDPGLPARDMRMTVESMPTYEYDSPVGIFPVMGRPAPVVVTDVRHSATGEVNIITQQAQDRDQLHLLTSTGHVLLLQTPPERGVGNMYVALQKTTEQRVVRKGVEDARLWTLQYVEVDEPSGAGVAGGTTWSDVVASYDSWSDTLLHESTWIDLIEEIDVGVTVPPETIVWRGA